MNTSQYKKIYASFFIFFIFLILMLLIKRFASLRDFGNLAWWVIMCAAIFWLCTKGRRLNNITIEEDFISYEKMGRKFLIPKNEIKSIFVTSIHDPLLSSDIQNSMIPAMFSDVVLLVDASNYHEILVKISKVKKIKKILRNFSYPELQGMNSDLMDCEGYHRGRLILAFSPGIILGLLVFILRFISYVMDLFR